jgi:hypothetical protein
MSKRGRPVTNPTELEKPIKFERRYEDEESITVWKYDLNKSFLYFFYKKKVLCQTENPAFPLNAFY